MENRVLKAVPEIGLVKMDEMVHDLTQALEEAHQNACPTARSSTGFRRRTRSAGNLGILANRTAHSDDSISERLISRSKEFSSFIQSDSDEISANSHRRLVPYPLQKRAFQVQQTANFESDSVNENFSPLRTGVRRKRKIKRMDCEALDLSRIILPGTSNVMARPSLVLPGPSGVRSSAKKKKVPVSKDVNGVDAAMGKRKRSTRERSAEVDSAHPLGHKLGHHHHRLHRQIRGDRMEMDRELMSSSSLSSSESEAGLQTNDEGREADDEQSDWFGGETRPEEETDLEPDDPALQNILNAPLNHINPDARQAYSERIEWLKEDMEREIRGGRRRVHPERPGFSVLTSANEKLSKFLQDCQKLTLRLHPMEAEEREQLLHLVELYSLRMRVEENCPVLVKTTATPRSIHIDPGALCIRDYKKRRKLPQPVGAVNTEMELG